ncbi:MAG: hypothetical protein HWN66_03730 [Candidatus Helarchaeota archaeon]|nr:hypothetical protein [Candidatus Helarchaeota archaeon]
MIEPIPKFKEDILNKNTETESFDGKFIGTGLPGNVTLICNQSGNAGLLASISSFNVPIPTSWVAKHANITVTNVLKESEILVVEEDAVDGIFRDTVETNYGMSFNIITTALLYNLSVYWDSIWKCTGVFVSVFNATQQGADPVPDTELYNESYPQPASYNAWADYSFTSPVLLDAQNTYANAFFIVFNASKDGSQGNCQWVYEDDGPGDDNGYAVEDQGSSWFVHPWDFTLRLGLRNNSRTPSDVDLKINGSSVIDTTQADGSWTSTFEFSNTTLNFQFSANSSAYFLVDYFVTYSQTNTQVVGTTFEGLDSSAIVWNASYDANFLADSFGERLEFSLPPWELATTVWNESSLHSQWNSTSDGSKRTITISNAENGTWTVQCNDTNYVENVYIKRSGITVSEINSTDTVEIYGNFTDILTTGDANLTIFPLVANYNDTFGEAITTNKTIKFSPLWTPTNTSTGSFMSAKLQVTWFNGTSAGIKTSNLTVNNIPTNLTYKSHTSSVDSGDSIFVYVNYSNEYTGEPLIGADLLVKNSTDDTTWPSPFQISEDYLNGTYKIEILTFGVVGGTHYLSVNLAKPLYLSSEISDISVTIGGIVSNISITAPNCIGLDSINQTYALANPAPYHNSTVEVTIFYYDNQTLEPLKNGIITGSWIGGGPTISWVPAFFGYYNITIDVIGFYSETNHTLNILIQQGGYLAAELNIIVPVRKLPTRIEPLQPSYSGYLLESLIVQAIFQDTHHDEAIPTVYDLGGNCTIRIENTSQLMTILSPTIGIYQILLDLSMLGVSEGQFYNMTISAFSSEHEFALTNVSLFIIPRNEVNLILLAEPEYLLAGIDFKLYARLTYLNGTNISNAILNTKVIFQPGGLEDPSNQITNSSGIAEITGEALVNMNSTQIIIEYLGTTSNQNITITSSVIPIIKLNSSLILSPLPAEIMQRENLEVTATLQINGTPAANKIITFTFVYDESASDIKVAGTNAEGKATITLKVPSGITKIGITASYDEGLTYVNASSTESIEINVISFFTLIGRSSPIWGSILVMVAIGVVTYQYRIRRPKKRRELIHLEEISSKFEDIQKMIYIMFLLKKGGVALVEYPVSSTEINPVLIAGFLNAITSFKDGIVKPKEGIQTGEAWELDYENFKILWIDGELTYFTLLSEKKLSSATRKNTAKLLGDFEALYRKDLTKFLGDVKIFQPTANNLIKKHLEVDLILPHKVDLTKLKENESLTKVESALTALGIAIEEERGYFYLTKLLSTASSARGESHLKLLGVIYNLWNRGIFAPITTKESESDSKKKLKTEKAKAK